MTTGWGAVVRRARGSREPVADADAGWPAGVAAGVAAGVSAGVSAGGRGARRGGGAAVVVRDVGRAVFVAAAAGVAFAVSVALGAAGCQADDEGAGPVTYPVPECGEPWFAEASGLRRLPYLQDVQPESARVVFTATTAQLGVVEYAPTADGPWTAVAALPEVFTTARTGDVVDYTAWEARLTGLDDGRTYCYRVLLGDEVVAQHLTFSTAWRDVNRSVRILALGDSGRGNDDQRAVRDQFMQREYDVFLHLGDMAYDDGTFVEFEENMFRVYERFLHRVPSWPTMGNHEFRTGGGRPYLDVYYLPEVARNPADHERYYSFDYGNVHFVTIDSNELTLGLAVAQDRLSASDANMIAWLRDDLAASEAEWKIAFFHHPAYTSSSSREGSALVREAVLSILEEGGVDLVLVGHDHFYERSHPILGGAVDPENPRAITYVIAGFGGTNLTATEDGHWHSAHTHDSTHGFVDLTIAGCVATGTVIDAFGDVVDRFSVNGCD